MRTHLRLEFCSGENPTILGSIKPPKMTIAHNDNVAIAADVACFGV